MKSSHITLDLATGEHDLRDFYYTFVELCKFTKDIDELESDTERWYFYLKNAQETIGEVYEKMIAQTPILVKAYKELDKAYWSEAEMHTYDEVTKHALDTKAKLDYKYKEGLKEGRQEGLHEIALKMLAQGYPAGEIQRLTGVHTADLQGPRQ